MNQSVNDQIPTNIPVNCQAQSQLQLSWTELALISTFPHPPPHPQGKYHGGHFTLVEPSLTVDKWSRTNLTMQNLSMEHLSRQHLSMQHLSMQHLSLQHLSEQHLSRDKIWLFTIATTPVWTKQSNFKLATEPNQNLANSSFY